MPFCPLTAPDRATKRETPRTGPPGIVHDADPLAMLIDPLVAGIGAKAPATWSGRKT